MKLNRTGLLLVLFTALVSGFSIFLNSFAIAGVNASLFALLKNSAVAVFLISAIVLFREVSALKALSKKQWAKLVGVGLIGGSIPFLLFFNALKITSAVNAAFIHKTLFVWVSLFAVFFLREKINKQVAVGAGLLLAGIVLLFGINISSFAFADSMILVATLLWASETVLSKSLLKELNSRIVAFGRMFFGAGFILAWLSMTGEIAGIASLGFENIAWVFAGSLLLFLYVASYYAGLKRLPASVASSILLLGLPITALLNFVFVGKPVSVEQGIGFGLLIAGIAVIAGAGCVLERIRTKNLSTSKHSF